MIIKKSEAKHIKKAGVDMHIYNTPETKGASLVYQETGKGHSEEFYNTKSTFMYYILEGKGSWFINGVEHKVKAGDLVIIKPKNKIYYKGKLKQVLIVTPPYNAKYAHHVRDIKL